MIEAVDSAVLKLVRTAIGTASDRRSANRKMARTHARRAAIADRTASRAAIASSSSRYFRRGQKKPFSPSPLVRGTMCTCRCGTLWLTRLLTATNVPSALMPASTARHSSCTFSNSGPRIARPARPGASRNARAARAACGRETAAAHQGRPSSAHPQIRSAPACSRARYRKRRTSRSLSRRGSHYSGSGFPFVSGANGSAARPTRNTRHMVTPAGRMGSA